MATIKFDDPKYHVEITSTSPIQLIDSDGHATAFSRFVAALDALDAAITPEKLEVLPDAGDIKYKMTFADTRTYRALLRVVPGGQHLRSVTQTSFFALPELLTHNLVVEACLGLLAESVTNITVDWTP
jgi:hypothetical protein